MNVIDRLFLSSFSTAVMDPNTSPRGLSAGLKAVHELHHCHLRLVPCPNGCGVSLPSVELPAHVRAEGGSCPERLQRCRCVHHFPQYRQQFCSLSRTAHTLGDKCGRFCVQHSVGDKKHEVARALVWPRNTLKPMVSLCEGISILPPLTHLHLPLHPTACRWLNDSGSTAWVEEFLWRRNSQVRRGKVEREEQTSAG